MPVNRWSRQFLKRVGFMVTCMIGLCSSFSQGKTMDAQDFFSDQQLAAYQLARKGEIDNLIKATQRGVDLNLPGKEDMTLLGLAVLNADRRAIVTLMRAGASANQIIPGAGSPAVLAITHHYNPPRTAALTAILDGGYDPNQLLSRGTPYLFYFVNYSHWPGLKLAIERGANINVQRKGGESLLTYLIQAGDYAQARELIAMGADVTARGERNESALREIEYEVTRVNPSIRKVWKEVIAMRELILSKLPDPKDRRSIFTDEAEEKIRLNP